MSLPGETTADTVRRILAEQLGHDEKDVTDEKTIRDDLGADSLDGVELVLSFEEEYSIEITLEEAEKIITVGDAIKAIEQHLES
jgi:acyl carrier protein